MIEVLTYNIKTRQEEWIKVEFAPVKPIEIDNSEEKIKRRVYYKQVWEITLKNDISEIMGDKERGFHKYHIDHIIPIIYGYKNNISPEIIGHRDNLRPLYWKDNLLKSSRLNAGI